MRVALVFPPVWDPKQPYLSLPALAAYLRERDVEVDLIDLNILSFHWMLEDEWIPGGAPATPPVSVPAAAAVRDPASFYRMSALRRGLGRLHERFAAVSRVFHPTKVGLYAYRMRDAATNVRDLLRACEDESQNPYLVMWQSKNVAASVLRGDPVLVGISVPSIHQLIPAVTLARLIKLEAPEMPIYLGGDAVSRFAPRLASREEWFAWIDGIVTHEGEKPLLELCRCHARGHAVESVPNLLYREGGGARRTREGDSLEPGEIPVPDFHGLPMELYLSPEPVLPIQASRGCYWGQCAFCSHTETIRRFRAQPAAVVAEVMRALAEQHGTRHFVFTDNAIPANLLRQLPSEIERLQLDVCWSCCARFDVPADQELWSSAARSGMISVWFGLESGSARELKLMRKGTTPEQARRVMQACLSAVIAVDLFVMVGFPGATKADVVETYSFIAETLPRGAVPQPLLAVGRFALDSCCDVARNPDRYGVWIDDDTPEDLPLNLPYHSREGMQATEAGRATSWLIDKLERLHPSFPLQVSDREAHSLLLRSRGIGMEQCDFESRIANPERLTTESRESTEQSFGGPDS